MGRISRYEQHLESFRELADREYDGIQIAEILGVPRNESKQLVDYARRNGIRLVTKRGFRRGARNPNWSGGKRMRRGYILVRNKEYPEMQHADGYVLEHRLVMARHLGRPLDPSEVVHHENGDGSDNRIENLRLYETNGRHLADTLAGQTPEWTEDGLRKLESLADLRRGKPQSEIPGFANLHQSENGGTPQP